MLLHEVRESRGRLAHKLCYIMPFYLTLCWSETSGFQTSIREVLMLVICLSSLLCSWWPSSAKRWAKEFAKQRKVLFTVYYYCRRNGKDVFDFFSRKEMARQNKLPNQSHQQLFFMKPGPKRYAGSRKEDQNADTQEDSQVPSAKIKTLPVIRTEKWLTEQKKSGVVIVVDWLWKGKGDIGEQVHVGSQARGKGEKTGVYCMTDGSWSQVSETGVGICWIGGEQQVCWSAQVHINEEIRMYIAWAQFTGGGIGTNFNRGVLSDWRRGGEKITWELIQLVRGPLTCYTAVSC